MKVIGENSVRGVFGHGSFPWGPPSIIKVDGLSIPDEGVFVKSATVEKSEKKGIIQCFNNINHVYAFGQDPESSRYSITFGVLMQAPGCASEFQSGGAVGKMIEEYKRLRVSKNPAVVNMMIDDGSVLGGILVGLSVAVDDPAINLFSITLAFTDLDVV